MRKIAIVGGGQSGLQLALGLLKNNYGVEIFGKFSGQIAQPPIRNAG